MRCAEILPGRKVNPEVAGSVSKSINKLEIMRTNSTSVNNLEVNAFI